MRLFFIGLMIAGLFGGFIQTSESALQSMVATERAFAQMSADKGTREAFLSFIADDGILFRPTAVKGKQWMIDHPVPVSTKRPLLSWSPIYADIAQSGDLGYTTGPWQFKSETNDPKAAAFGDFITVWKKQSDGTWKFVVDLGVSHAEPTTSVSFQPANAKSTRPKKHDGAEQLLKVDRELSDATSKKGHAEFVSQMADDIRLFRNDRLPFLGRPAATAAISANSTVWGWEPAFSDVSAAGDLGYTYGSYWRKNQQTLVEKGNYLRIWKQLDGTWRVVVDVADPLPLEEKNN